MTDGKCPSTRPGKDATVERSPRRSHFAPSFRPMTEDVQALARYVESSPVVSTILRSVGRPAVVLDKHRTIVGCTREFRKWIDREDAELIGLRIGEVLGCMHAGTEPDGCGTTPWCSTCGVGVATHMSQVRKEPVGREGVLQRLVEGRPQNRAYTAFCIPLLGDGPELHFLAIGPRSDRSHSVEAGDPFWGRMQDLARRISELVGELEDADSVDTTSLRHAVQAMEGEIRAQVAILRGPETIPHDPGSFPVPDLFEDLRREFQDQVGGAPAGSVDFRCEDRDLAACSMRRIVHVVLWHMVSNALDASVPGERVVVEAVGVGQGVEFTVWNAEEILPHFALRIFEKNFTTKDPPHRGLGTWTMKLLGEEVLGGEVRFTSRSGEGTRFHLRLPDSPAR